MLAFQIILFGPTGWWPRKYKYRMDKAIIPAINNIPAWGKQAGFMADWIY